MTRFATRMPPIGDSFDDKLVMTNDDLRGWAAAGKPPLTGKQLAALARSAAYVTGQDPEEVVQLCKATRSAILLSQPTARPASPSHTPGNPTSSRPTKAGRTSGNGPRGKKARKALKRAQRVQGSVAAGEAIQLGDIGYLMSSADPDLVALWREQMETDHVVTLSQPPPPTGSAPLGMDDQRFELHRQAQDEARARCLANPMLDEAQEYGDACVRILDRQAGVTWPSA